MLLMGDEVRRTQQGNNNAYCQDNEISWIDWGLAESRKPLVEYTRKLIELRHKYPILRRNLFLTGDYDEELGIKDVTWINANGSEMEDRNWGDTGMRCFGMLIDGRAQVSGIRQRGKEATLLMIVNGHSDVVNFTLPEAVDGSNWLSLIDTNGGGKDKSERFEFKSVYEVTARSLLLFALQGG